MPTRSRPRIGVAVGDRVLDLAAALDAGRSRRRSRRPNLERLHGAGARRLAAVCDAVAAATDERAPKSRASTTSPTSRLLHLPFDVADYVDFYSSRAPRRRTSAGSSGPDAEPLTPNWKHLPIGYHGRAGTVRRVGHRVVRPHGQRRPPTDDAVVRARRGGWTSRPRSASSSASPSELGRPVPLDGVRRARVRRLPGQRLVGARHPGLGVRAARAVPRQVVPDLGVAVGGAARRAGRRPRRPAAARPPPLPYLRRRRRPVGPGPRAGGAAQRRAGLAAAVPRDVLDRARSSSPT